MIGVVLRVPMLIVVVAISVPAGIEGAQSEQAAAEKRSKEQQETNPPLRVDPVGQEDGESQHRKRH